MSRIRQALAKLHRVVRSDITTCARASAEPRYRGDWSEAYLLGLSDHDARWFGERYGRHYAD